ncbi:ADM_collapsed_G0016590.mRNA.1.CDS.1 [Saccharomyces cerevisiae]|nr:ADM_collapsed_G0016590.mRNA.1.CDS.1 [Saccharomyces cerevisiae]
MLIYHCHHHICDENGCHVSSANCYRRNCNRFLPSHTPLLLLLTVTTMAVTPRLSLLNVLKKLQQPPISPKSYTTVTVTHCDDNGCKTKTITSEASQTQQHGHSTVTIVCCSNFSYCCFQHLHWYCRSIRKVWLLV